MLLIIVLLYRKHWLYLRKAICVPCCRKAPPTCLAESKSLLYLGFLSVSTSLLTHEPEVGEKNVNRESVLWTCLEVVPRGDSTLLSVQSKEQTPNMNQQ
jgi:hypothetical protein